MPDNPFRTNLEIGDVFKESSPMLPTPGAQRLDEFGRPIKKPMSLADIAATNPAENLPQDEQSVTQRLVDHGQANRRIGIISDDRSTFRKAMARGVDQTQALGYGAIAAGADLINKAGIGDGDVAEWALEGYYRNMDEASRSVGGVMRIQDIHSAGDLGSFLVNAVGEQLPTLASVIAGGGIGGIVGKAAAKKAIAHTLQKKASEYVAKGMTKEVAEKAASQQIAAAAAKLTTASGAVGQGAGAYGMGFGLSSGEIMGAIAEETGELRGDVAVAAGAIAGALEALPVLRIFDRAGVDVSKAGKEIASRSMRVMKSAGIQGGIESITEGAQTVIEQMAVAYVAENKDLFTTEDMWEIANAMAKGGTVGVAIGVPSAIAHTSSRSEQSPVAEMDDLQRKKAEVRQKAAQAQAESFRRATDDPTVPVTKPIDDLDVQKGLAEHEAVVNDKIKTIAAAAEEAYAQGDDAAVTRAANQIKALKADHEALKSSLSTDTLEKAAIQPDSLAAPSVEVRAADVARKLPDEDVFATEQAALGAEALEGEIDFTDPLTEYEQIIRVRPEQRTSAEQADKRELERRLNNQQVKPGDVVASDGKPYRKARRARIAAEKAMKRPENKGKTYAVEKLSEGRYVAREVPEVPQGSAMPSDPNDRLEIPDVPAKNQSDAGAVGTGKQPAAKASVESPPPPAESVAPEVQGQRYEPDTTRPQPGEVFRTNWGQNSKPVPQAKPGEDQQKLIRDWHLQTAADVARGRNPYIADQFERMIQIPQMSSDSAIAYLYGQGAAAKARTEQSIADSGLAPPKPKPETEPKAEAKPDVEQKPKPKPKPKAKPKPAPKASIAEGVGQNNKLFTRDMAEEALAQLRAELGTLSAGINPKIINAGMTLSAFYVEAGVRSFGAYSAQMVKDLGEKIRPYLPYLYETVRTYPGFDSTGMTPKEEVDAIVKPASEVKSDRPAESSGNEGPPDSDTGQPGAQDGSVAPDRAQAAERVPAQDRPDTDAQPVAGGRDTPLPADVAMAGSVELPPLRDEITRRFSSIGNNRDLKRVVADVAGIKPVDVSPAQLKTAQEAYEAALVRQVAQRADTFDDAVQIYKGQPNLSTRSGDSMSRQAYSTPAPLANAASRLAIADQGAVYDNSAGFGMLGHRTPEGQYTAVELDPVRAQELRDQGVQVTQGDALSTPLPGPQDAYIANPPFGKIDQPFELDGQSFTVIDHAIVARGLSALKDDGRAALIIGANMEPGRSTPRDDKFFRWLYGNYKVVDHFEADGTLYSRQGAAWPVRVLTIRGREKSDRVGPAEQKVERFTTWDQVNERVNEVLDAEAQNGLDERADSIARRNNARGDRLLDSLSNGATGSDRGTGRGNASGQRGGMGDGGQGAGERSQSADGDGRGHDGSSAVGRPGSESDKRPGGTESGRVKAGGRPAGRQSVGDRADADVEQGAVSESLQVPYKGASTGHNAGALVPANMAEPLARYFQRLESKVGSIDDYVIDKLGYADKAALHKAFMGVQVDGIAAAVHNYENGGKAVIIADATGLGKGRQVAGILRYAKKIGKTPVFVTIKDNLFTDMYGDMADIGMQVKPFIMNAGAQIKVDGRVMHKGPSAAARTKALKHIAETGTLPAGHDALFLTYSQISAPSNAKGGHPQRNALEALAKNNAFIVFDESHTMSGTPMALVKVGKGFAWQETGAGFMRSVAKLAPVSYVSATYAKRPDNMSAYAQTSLGDAMPRDTKEPQAGAKGGMMDGYEDPMAKAMAQGGVPLQQVVANELAERGQLLRRERSFDGIKVNAVFDEANASEHRAMYDSMVKGFMAIMQADQDFHTKAVKALKEQVKGASGSLAGAGNRASVRHTGFSSVIGNYVGQVLAGMKAKSAVELAIELHKKGERPVIAMVNTMGSFLSNYSEEAGLNVGDKFTANYQEVLLRALDRTRRVSIERPGIGKIIVSVSLDKVGPSVRQSYEGAEEIIRSLEIKDIPVSPIDYMRNALETAGVKTSEITGRGIRLDYTSDTPVLAKRPMAEIKDKRKPVDDFNSGKVEALILNQSGSTGLSIHNSVELAEDQQKKRHMIVMQMDPDVNVLMQMLGRINRTGQREEPELKPEFTILGTSLPAEKRLMASSLRKLSSLNANTSANSRGSTTFDAPDFLNQYGDEVVAEYLQDKPRLAKRLGVTTIGEDSNAAETYIPADYALQVTGRLAARASVKQQEEFYTEVEQAYADKIDYLDKIGQNRLRLEDMDIGARIIESREIVDAAPGEKNTAISGRAVLHTVDAKAIKKPPQPKDVKIERKKALDESGANSYQQMRQALEAKPDKAIKEAQAALKDVIAEVRKNETPTAISQDMENHLLNLVDENIGKAIDIIKSIEANGQRADESRYLLKEFRNSNEAKVLIEHGKLVGMLQATPPGSRVIYDRSGSGENAVEAMVIGVKHKPDAENPYRMGGIRVRLATKSKMGTVTISGSQATKTLTSADLAEVDIDEMFQGDVPERETLTIITGNLVAGMERYPSGQVIRFTDETGRVYNGILDVSSSGVTDSVGDRFIVRDANAASKMLEKMKRGEGVSTTDPSVSIVSATTVGEKATNVEIRVLKSGASKNARMLTSRDGKAQGMPEFYTQPSQQHYAAVVPIEQAARVIKAMHAFNILITAPETMRDAYVAAGGPKKATAGSFDVNQAANASQIDALPKISAEQRHGGMSTKAVRRHVQSLTRQWQGAPKIVVHETTADLPSQYREKLRGPVKGLYQGRENVVHLVADRLVDVRDVERVLLHETQHMANRQAYGPDYQRQMNRLVAAIEENGGVAAVAEAMSLKYDHARYEAIFDRFGAFGAEVRGRGHAEEMLARLAEQGTGRVGKVRQYARQALAALRKWLRSNGFRLHSSLASDELVMAVKTTRTYLRSPGLFRRAPGEDMAIDALPSMDGSAAGKSVWQSHQERLVREIAGRSELDGGAQSKARAAMAGLKPFQDSIEGMSDSAKKQALGSLSRRQLIEWGQKYTPRMKDYLAQADQLDEDRRSLQVEGGHISDDWSKLSPAQMENLAKAMQASTVAGIDPSVPYRPTGDYMKDQIRDAMRPDIQKLWAALGPAEKEIYQRARDHHVDLSRQYEAAIEKQIMQMEGSREKRVESVAQLKKMFEMNRVDAPYFPLSRFGNYWVSVKFGDEDSTLAGERSVDRFETKKAAEAFVAQQRALGHEVNFGQDSQELAELLAVPPEFVKIVDNLVEGSAGVDPEQNKALRDDIFQAYLNTLPQLSARHHHQHRQNVRGFSQDALKAFAHSSFHSAYMVARTRHMPEMDRTLEAIRADIEQAGSPDKTQQKLDDLQLYEDNYLGKPLKEVLESRDATVPGSKDRNQMNRIAALARRLRTADEVRAEARSLGMRRETASILKEPRERLRAVDYLDELISSHKHVKAPNVSPWATALNSLGFGFYLGFTPAAAFVNMSQVPLVSMPILAGKYGQGRAWNALNRAYKDFFAKPSKDNNMTAEQKRYAPDRTIRNQLSGDEAAAFDELVNRGVIDVTQFHDLAGIAEEGRNYGPIQHKMMRYMSWMFHHAERLNREVTAMAVYRLAREKGLSYDGAISEAADQTYYTQFDYGSTNRARFFRGNVARVIFQFKQYSAGITFLYIDTIRRARGKGMFNDPAEIAIARRQLAGLIGMQTAAAGALGLPLVSTAGAAAELAVHAFSDNDDWDYEAAMRQGLMDILTPVTGAAGAQKASTLAFKGAVDAFTPASVSGRLSLSDLWIRDPYRPVEGRDLSEHLLKQLAGPMYGLAEGVFEGAHLIGEGDVYKGFQAMAPKAIRDQFKAYGYAQEGVVTGSGNPILDVNAIEIILQSMGFSPSAIVQKRDENQAKSNKQATIQRIRGNALRTLNDAKESRDSRAIRDAMSMIDAFNQRYSTYQITDETIRRSEAARQTAREQTQGGVRLNMRLQDVADYSFGTTR